MKVGSVAPEKTVRKVREMNDLSLYFANNFIAWGLREGTPLTPLRLQKLLYLYYARHMHRWGVMPFINSYFEKWPKGPVLRDVYETLKPYGGGQIDREIRDIRGDINRIVPDDEHFMPVFHEVTGEFGNLSSTELVRLTHDGPPGTIYETAWAKAPGMGYPLHLADIKEDGRVLFGGA